MKIVLQILIILVLLFIAKQLWDNNKLLKELQFKGSSTDENKRTPNIVKVENKIEKVADSAMSVFGALKQGMIARGY